MGPGCTRPEPSGVGGSARATAAPGGDQAWPCAVCPAPRSEGPRRLPGRRAGGAGRGRGGGHPGAQVPVAWLSLKHRAVRRRARGSRAAGRGGGAGRGGAETSLSPFPSPPREAGLPQLRPGPLGGSGGAFAGRRGVVVRVRRGEARPRRGRTGRGPGHTAAVAAADL